MYLEHFHLSRLPFQNTPDPAFFFASHSHRQALASMLFGIEHAQGFVLVIGDVGTGKTLLVQALKKELGDRHVLVEISNPWATPESVLAAIRSRVDLPPEDSSPSFDSLKERLQTLARAGQRVILVIDEAHQLSERMIEGIRLLSNIETADEKLLQIVFLGQNELAGTLGRYSMRQVQQRVAQNYHLQCLSADETSEYIQHRLRIAGGTPLLFPPECIKLIYQESGGAPRAINRLCDACLLTAFGRKAPQVTSEIVREAIANLHPERTIAPDEAQATRSPSLPRADNNIPPSLAAAPTTAPATAPATASPPPSSNTTQVSAAPEPELPFQMPGAATASLAETKKPGVIRPLHLFIALGAGLAAGAFVFWFQAQPGKQPASNEMPRHVQLPAVETAPPVAAPSPTSTAAASPTTDTAAPKSHEMLIPLPGSKAAALPVEDALVPSDGGLSLLASGKFGAWNESIRDLIAASNPEISTPLDGLTGGNRLKLPKLTREGLIVKDATGRFFVYFASFESQEEARLNLEAIRRIWSEVQLVAGTRGETQNHRLFIGPFASQGDAGAAAGSLWFKHLPTLN